MEEIKKFNFLLKISIITAQRQCRIDNAVLIYLVVLFRVACGYTIKQNFPNFSQFEPF